MDEEFAQFLDIAVEHPQNLALSVLSKSMFDGLASDDLKRKLLTSLEVTRQKPDALNPSGQSVGCYLAASEDYEQLGVFFNKVLAKVHESSNFADEKHPSNWDVRIGPTCDRIPQNGLLDVKDFGFGEVAIRVRTCRNIRGFKLPSAMSKTDRIECETLICKGIDRLIKDKNFGGNYYSLTEGHPQFAAGEEVVLLTQSRVMFRPAPSDPVLSAAGFASDWPYGRGCYVSEDQTLFIWVGLEDHLRVMAMDKGAVLNRVFDRVKSCLDEVEEGLTSCYALNPRFGVVTSCPSNSGTALHASIVFPLPRLMEKVSEAGVKDLLASANSRVILKSRGDNTVEVKPAIRLGISEAEMIVELYQALKVLGEAEEEADYVLKSVEVKLYSIRGMLSSTSDSSKKVFVEASLSNEDVVSRSDVASLSSKGFLLGQVFDFPNWNENHKLTLTLFEKKMLGKTEMGSLSVHFPRKNEIKGVMKIPLRQKYAHQQQVTLGVRFLKIFERQDGQVTKRIQQLLPRPRTSSRKESARSITLFRSKSAKLEPKQLEPPTDKELSRREEVIKIYHRIVKQTSAKPRDTQYSLPSKINNDDFEYMSILGKGSFGKVLRVRYVGKDQKIKHKRTQIEKEQQRIKKEKESKKVQERLRNGTYKPKSDEKVLQYAMKIVEKEKIIQDNESRTEIEIMKLMRGHPFIVRIERWFETKKHISVVMELGRGGTMDQVVRRWKKGNSHKNPEKVEQYERTARVWAAEICLALGQLHRMKIIYRDLKPDNILLDHVGHVRLCDLGVSYRVKSKDLPVEAGEEKNDENKLPNLEIGGSGYKAPEMLRGQKYSYSVDWFSLGICVFQLLAGKHPFSSKYKLFHDRDRAVSRIEKGSDVKYIKRASPEANDFVMSLLHPDPAQRLGGGENDAGDVMAHPFFKRINWEALGEERFAMQRNALVPDIPNLDIIIEDAAELPEYDDLEDAMDMIDKQDVALQLGLQVGIQ